MEEQPHTDNVGLNRFRLITYTLPPLSPPPPFPCGVIPQAGTSSSRGVRAGRSKPGPKKGSHNKKAAPLPEADDFLAAARLNVDSHKHLSEKINYRVLDDLFEETAEVAEGPGRVCVWGGVYFGEWVWGAWGPDGAALPAVAAGSMTAAGLSTSLAM